MMDFDDDFDFMTNDIKCVQHLTNDYEKDNFDFPIFHSTPSISRSKQVLRPVDYPSIKQYYGIVTFSDYKLPIIYRLINETHYIPYIRFSYVLNIFEHPSYKEFSIDVRNLPIIEMTSIEKIYYDQISSLTNDTDWSNNQLLSVSMLDGVLAIINLTEYFHSKTDSSSIEQYQKWREAMNTVRHEAHDRWILDEKTILIRLKENKDDNKTCISSTTIAKRRALIEQRLDLSIVDEEGGFVQIDSYIYPYVKNQLDNQLYINLNDIRQTNIPLSSYMIYYSNRESAIYRSYTIVIEQAQSNYEWNIIRHGRNNDLLKYLPGKKRIEEHLSDDNIPFISLQTFLHLFLNKKSNINIQFVQLFETSSLDEIEFNYKNNVARQFIMITKRQGGFINGNIPCLIFPQLNQPIIWIPSETKTQRKMTNDERLYLNIILLYYGLWKKLLTRKKQWYLKEIDGNDKENLNLEILFNV
ncbi:unnamed protein product [Adineta steineri]|uniref:Uncharacterized protein n=1 Tax=Adineta steineri TaxID=433720 RepID=A0A818GSB0_9BILA|nr:unnamed protein product [Adineta steineri]CAF3493056.1 unnamed protein product [Adineta steineri]